MVHHVNIAMWKRHFLFFVFFFSLLGVAQENCTTRSSYVQYSTPQQATGFSMGAHYAGNFLGKEKQWIEKKKKISLETQALWAESAARLRRIGWAEGGAKGGA